MLTTSLTTGTMIRLDVSLWSAKARLKDDDVSAAMSDLPPKALATLGSKRLLPPEALRPFATMKARAWNLLDLSGPRFLGGWLVKDNACLKSLDADLSRIKTDFDRAVDDLRASYDEKLSDWCSSYPEWEAMIRKAAPSSGKVASKFAFSWQAFTFAPVHGTTAGIHAQDALTHVGDSALEEICKMASYIYEETFKGRQTVTQRTLRALLPLATKADAVAFVHPHLATVARVISEWASAARQMEGTQAALSVQAFLLAMQNRQTLLTLAQDVTTHKTTSEGMITALVQAGSPAKPSPAPVQDLPLAAHKPEPLPTPPAFITLPTPEAPTPAAQEAPRTTARQLSPQEQSLLDMAKEALAQTQTRPGYAPRTEPQEAPSLPPVPTTPPTAQTPQPFQTPIPVAPVQAPTAGLIASCGLW